MEIDKTYTGSSEEEIWRQINADINDDILELHAIIMQGKVEVYLDIDIDLGGGFEGGYATTSYRAPISNHDFRFAIHEEHFIDDIGKFLGIQDGKTGYPDIDSHLMIKSNDKEKIKTLFADHEVRRVFLQLTDFDFGIQVHAAEDSDEKIPFLELNIEDGITDKGLLRELYHVFVEVLKLI